METTLEMARRLMEEHGVPGRDLYEIPDSPLTFPDGAHYRYEISGVERLSTLEALVDEMQKTGQKVHRIICTVMGATLLRKSELVQFAKLAHDAKLEAIITPGPRIQWDTGRVYQSARGVFYGGRPRGSDWVSYYIADILRCIEFGFRGFLVWDEGVLKILNEMREKGDIPKEVVFKMSVFAGHANAADARLLEKLGANTFNPIGDLSLPMLAGIRKASRLPMDIYVYVWDQAGSINRFWEVSELARVAAPCYFKIEPGSQPADYYTPWTPHEKNASFAREKVWMCEVMEDLMKRGNPRLRTSEVGVKDLVLPVV